MQALKIYLCQFDIQWENASANRDKLSQIFSQLPTGSVDVMVLPEMFTTGFTMRSADLAETMDEESVLWMKKMANQYQMAITGSLIISENDNYYNRLLWVEPENENVCYYDKKHLFSLAGEQNHYTAGNQNLRIQWKGWNICFYICYDLRFPVWTRNTEEDDLIIFIANFPEKREKAWNTLLPARAIENQCYVAAVNRTGTDGNGIPHRGDSAIYDYEGIKILDLQDIEQLLGIHLDHQKLQIYKRAYPFLRDRDLFHLK